MFVSASETDIEMFSFPLHTKLNTIAPHITTNTVLL